MSEKRRLPRYETSVQCYVEKMYSDSGRTYSRIVNQNDYGVKLETNVQYYSGDHIKIYMAEEKSDYKPLVQNYCVGEVRWCAKDDAYSNAMYGVGVELKDQLDPLSVSLTQFLPSDLAR